MKSLRRQKMKPTSIQKEVIETSKRLISYWLSTNDLDSLSHITIIKDEINALDDINTEEKDMLILDLIDLLKTIKYLAV